MTQTIKNSFLAVLALLTMPMQTAQSSNEKTAQKVNQDTILTHLYNRMNPPVSWSKVPEEDKQLISQTAFSSHQPNPVQYMKQVLVSYLIAQLKGEKFNLQSINKYQSFLLAISDLDSVTYDQLKGIT